MNMAQTEPAVGAPLEREARRGGRELIAALAKALGLPKNTVRAVLTLDATEPPRLELTMDATDAAGRPIVEEVPGEYGEGMERRIAQVQFMVRLERFPGASA
jgi:hypothetical protein